MNISDEKILRSKLAHTFILETTNAGQEYRVYFTKKQIDKILEIIKRVNDK